MILTVSPEEMLKGPFPGDRRSTAANIKENGLESILPRRDGPATGRPINRTRPFAN